MPTYLTVNQAQVFLEDAASLILSTRFGGSGSGMLPTEEDVEFSVRQFVGIMVGQLEPTSRETAPIEEIISAAIKTLTVRFAIRMGRGVGIAAAKHRPWLQARLVAPGCDRFYWNRYRKYLETKGRLSLAVTRNIDFATDALLDYCGDPLDPLASARYGLILGDVQSGKTATYCGLVCKAADVGYRIIVILAGAIETLRSQTQVRMDEGFVGKKSALAYAYAGGGSRLEPIGVGAIDGRRFASVLTSSNQDFSKDAATQIGLPLANLNEAVLLVVKKDATILKNLIEWLRTRNAQNGAAIKSPLLVIDDEADNASVNTGEGTEPKTINRRIRELLGLFERRTYVGITATPFANAFIDSEIDHEEYDKDIFPSDFFYALDAPSDYLGVSSLSADGGESRTKVCTDTDDAEEWLPLNHKISATPGSVPSSLVTALTQYFLINAIRDIRGDQGAHRSMLVNVSRFVAVQRKVARQIVDHLDVFNEQLRLYSRLPVAAADRQSSQIQHAHEVFETHFAECGFEWKDVLECLEASCRTIEVFEVNGLTTEPIDYSKASESKRVIAVGGNSLSRGITLEGLCVSYFYRRPQAFDTLLQMGRWFGYRFGYGDLCRVWMTEELQGSFARAEETVAELRHELERMNSLGMTPADFGLKIRHHPESLQICARNKMRSASTLEYSVSYSGRFLESARLGQSCNQANIQVVTDLLNSIISNRVNQPDQAESDGRCAAYYKGVRPVHISEFLSNFQVHPTSTGFLSTAAGNLGNGPSDFVANAQPAALQNWTVAVLTRPRGEGNRFTIPNTDISLTTSRRKVTIGSDGELLVSGSKSRVGSPGDEKIGLSATLQADADAEFKASTTYVNGKSVPDSAYRRKRQGPLLLIHFLTPEIVSSQHDVESSTALVAFGLSFPEFEDSATAVYRINLVEQRRLAAGVEIEDELS